MSGSIKMRSLGAELKNWGLRWSLESRLDLLLWTSMLTTMLDIARRRPRGNNMRRTALIALVASSAQGWLANRRSARAPSALRPNARTGPPQRRRGSGHAPEVRGAVARSDGEARELPDGHEEEARLARPPRALRRQAYNERLGEVAMTELLKRAPQRSRIHEKSRAGCS